MKMQKGQIAWMEFYLAVVKYCEEDHLGSVTRIYNTSGRRIQSYKVSKSQGDMLRLPKGIYIQNGKKVVVKKGAYPQPLPALRREWGFAPLCGAAATLVAALKTPVAPVGRGRN